MSEEDKNKEQMGILKPAHKVFEGIVEPDKMNKYVIRWWTEKRANKSSPFIINRFFTEFIPQ